MGMTLPTTVSGALGTLTQAFSDWNIVDSDTAGTVKSVFDALSGQGTGVPAGAQTTVPTQTVSPVSADAKPAEQKATQPLSTKTKLIIAGAVGFVIVGAYFAWR